ncbi:MAG: hypothetical protein K2K04_00570, partial [Clostridia bacterium]|nr:hypothetical protein [Clostridia bacterium]
LLLNLLFIPLLSALYILLFRCAGVSVVVPAAAGALLGFAALPISLIINVVTESGFENALISGEFGNWLYVPFALLVIGVTDKLNLRPFLRSVYPCAFALLVLVSSVTSAWSGGFAVVEFNSGYHGGSVTITTDQGTLFVITENFEIQSGQSSEADILIVLGGDNGLPAVTALGENYERVYMRGSAPPVPYLGEMPIYYADSFTACGVNFTYRGNTLAVDVYGTEIALVQGDRTFSVDKTGSDFELHCYRSKGAVLQTGGGEYALNVCGTMRYEISMMGYNPLHVIPRE